MPASRAIRSQLRAAVDVPWPGLGGDDRDDDLGARQGQPTSRHEAVPAVVAGAAQDDDGSRPPAIDVDRRGP